MKESDKKDKYLDLGRELDKTGEHESDGNINCNWRAQYIQQKIGTETRRLGNKTTSRFHLNHGIVNIGQNTEKSPGDLLSLKLQ